MSIAAYELATLATMASFLFLMCALAEARVLGPAAAYAAWCFAMGGATFAAVRIPAFAPWFYDWGLPAAACGFLVFLGAEGLLVTWGGARWQELVAAAALWIGFVLSVGAGLSGPPGAGRMLRQALAVCVPVATSAALILAGPQGLGATALWLCHWAGLPAPVAVARARR